MDPRGARGRSPPPHRLGPKKIIARPKNTHICKPPFACQNVLKLTYSNLEFQYFPGPTSKGREEEGRDSTRNVGKGRGGKEGGEGGEREGKEGGER